MPREIWAYRDYVIRSFNANKPFDQFTIEQIAGDLLPHPSEEQLIATAFHRNTQTNNEGGSDREEYRNVAIVDRVNTTMSVWMGTTMACAQCHDHKYDPISQKEYFQFFAIFNNTEDADREDEHPGPFASTRSSRRGSARSLQAEIAALEPQRAAEERVPWPSRSRRRIPRRQRGRQREKDSQDRRRNRHPPNDGNSDLRISRPHLAAIGPYTVPIQRELAAGKTPHDLHPVSRQFPRPRAASQRRRAGRLPSAAQRSAAQSPGAGQVAGR